jgi:DNA-binding NtrC family response regulator
MPKEKIPSVIYTAMEEFMLRLIRDMLRASGIKEVGTFRHIKDAVADIRAHARKWDIFLIDGNFPDAIDSISGIRQEFGPHIKLLLVMSTPTREDVVQATQAGINDFVVLPCAQLDYEDKIHRLMGKKVKPRQSSKTAVVYRKE